jgi:plastocyanin
MRRYFSFFILFNIAAAMIAGCAGLQEQVVLAPESMEQVVAMKASSFSFEPNNLKAYVGDTLIFKVQNLSGIGHNFTITGLGGEIVAEVDLPANETTEVKVGFKEAGTYKYYCDKPFHTTLGMQGQVVVDERP